MSKHSHFGYIAKISVIAFNLANLLFIKQNIMNEDMQLLILIFSSTSFFAIFFYMVRDCNDQNKIKETLKSKHIAKIVCFPFCFVFYCLAAVFNLHIFISLALHIYENVSVDEMLLNFTNHIMAFFIVSSCLACITTLPPVLINLQIKPQEKGSQNADTPGFSQKTQ